MAPSTFIPTYIEVLAGLLVLGVTLPSILITVPPRIRAIRDRHWPSISIGDKEVGLGDILQPEIVVALVVLSIIFLGGYLVPPLPFMCNQDGFGWWCKPKDFFTSHLALITYAILSFNVIITALFIGALVSYTKNRLLLSLARKYRRQVKKGNRRVDKAILESIGELGEFCDPGRDKESILDTLASIADLDLTFESWLHLAATVRETAVGGNQRNYIHAMGILQEIFRAASFKETNNQNNRELPLAGMLLELENVMIQAFTLRDSRVTATIMTGYDELALQAPNAYAHAFLRIGKAALDIQEMRQAGAILDKFHTKIMEELSKLPNADSVNVPEVIHIFFGLLAHFWYRDNTARLHALKYLKVISIAPGWNAARIDQQLQSAKTFFQSNDVTTADYLEQMLFQSNQLRSTESFLLSLKNVGEKRCQRILIHYPSIIALKTADRDGIVACGVPGSIAEVIIQKIKNL